MSKASTPILGPGDNNAGGRRSPSTDSKSNVLDLAALAVSIGVLRLALGEFPVGAAVCAFVTAVLLPLRETVEAPSPWDHFKASLPRRMGTVLTTALVGYYLLNADLRILLFGAIWPIIGWLLQLDWQGYQRRLGRLGSSLFSGVGRIWVPLCSGLKRLRTAGREESLRCLLLAAVALWLMRGFFSTSLRGGPDAQWYGLCTADAIAQFRSGVFPVWVGESIYQFNGAMCPIRVAPAFQYIGMLLDTLTLRSLGAYTVQNLLLVLIAIAATGISYKCLRSLLPGREWLALGLAVLFISCPGVLGLAYNSDLYMSWTALPLVPIVWLATARSFDERLRRKALFWLGAALGLAWWCHPPIALWATFIAGAAQLARLAMQGKRGLDPKAVFFGSLSYSAIAAYPISSVLFFPPIPHGHAEAYQQANAPVILQFIRDSFPGTLLPLSSIGRAQSDFQLGYALWALLFVVLVSLFFTRRREYGVTLGLAVLLASLVMPIPWICGLEWRLIPGFARDVTGNWAAPRLYLLFAGATVFAAAACISEGDLRNIKVRRLLVLLVALGCIWSLSEGRKFALGSADHRQMETPAVDLLRPENVALSRYSYAMFTHIPDSFTHGVTDPELENRLLESDLRTPISTNLGAALATGRVVRSASFTWKDNGVRIYVDVPEPFHIEPHRNYLLRFMFNGPPSVPGVLQIIGRHLFREYGLPDYGGTRSFGAGGDHVDSIALSTSGEAEDVTVRFFPKPVPPLGTALPQVGSVELIAYERDGLPVRMDSWIPYRASVRSSKKAWLESPRVYQSWYRGLVNGNPVPVEESANALVSVPVPKGAATVEINFDPPIVLKGLFWLSFATMAALGVFLFSSFGVFGRQ